MKTKKDLRLQVIGLEGDVAALKREVADAKSETNEVKNVLEGARSRHTKTLDSVRADSAQALQHFQDSYDRRVGENQRARDHWEAAYRDCLWQLEDSRTREVRIDGTTHHHVGLNIEVTRVKGRWIITDLLHDVVLADCNSYSQVELILESQRRQRMAPLGERPKLGMAGAARGLEVAMNGLLKAVAGSGEQAAPDDETVVD